MSDDTQTKFRLDLDTEDFKRAAKEAGEALSKIVDATQISAVAEVFTAFTVGLEGAKEVLEKVGEAAEWVFEQVLDAEKLNVINYQFEALSKNAGLSAGSLKEGFEKAADGMTPIAEILGVANKALINMGASGESLPKLFELAQNQARAFGTSSLEAFEGITRAVEFGNQRMLRQLGIKINLKKAEDDYARSVGFTGDKLSDNLTEEEKIRARVAALTKYEQENMVKTPENLRPVTDAWAKFKTQMVELSEVIFGLFDKAFGPLFTKIVNGAAHMAGAVRKSFIYAFGSEAQVAAISGVDQLHKRLTDLKKQAAYFQEIMSKDARPKAVEQARENYERLKKSIADVTKEIEKREEVEKKVDEKAEARARAAVANKKKADEDKIKDDKAYNEEKLRLDKQADSSEEKSIKTVADVDKLTLNRRKVAREEWVSDIAKIEALGLADSNKRQALYLAAEKKNTAALVAIDKKAADEKAKLVKKEFDLKSAAATAFTSNYMNSLKDMMSGQKDAGEAMKGFFFGMLGDMAVKQGEFMMLKAFESFPMIEAPTLAAGMALVALGEGLGALGSGSANQASAGASGGYESMVSKDAASLGASSTVDASGNLSTNAAPRQSVTIAVQGNYFETEQTKRHLAEIIREHQDATDFTFKQIGQA